MMVDISYPPRQFFFSFRPTRLADRLMTSVSSIKMVAMAKAMSVSPRSLAYTYRAVSYTHLDLILRRLDVRTVILTGTTTPNCIRTTCYDAIALEYNTVVLTDCCSSHTEEIQRVNLEDMARAGAILMDSASFADYGPGTVEDLSAAIRARMLEEDTVPEPFRSEDGQVFWPDLW